MSEMAECVARALEAHARETYRGTDVMTMLPPDWEPWIGSAQAALDAIGADRMYAAAEEWSAARRDCLGTKEVTAAQYDRLARAEAALQAVLK